MLDSQFTNYALGVAYLALFAGVMNYIERRWNPPPPRGDYLNDPDDIPWVSPWNIFSTKKWTPAGIRFHERRVLFCAILLGLLFVGFLLRDGLRAP